MADDGFVAFVRAKFESLPHSSSQPCIYKTPDHLREGNEDCYRPYVVSIGPLFYGRPSLDAMQDCKWSCLKFFVEHPSNSYKLDLEHYLTILREFEGRLRDCYAESITLPSDEFNTMVLVDSAFVICYFMKNHPSLSSSLLMLQTYKRSLLRCGYVLTRDLFLEENQIPLFVLERLFKEAFGAASPNSSFLDLACAFIADGGIPLVNGHVRSATTIARIKNGPKIVHLVDLLRTFCFPTILRDQAQGPTSSKDVQFPSSVSNLRAAGVKFVASKSTNLLDVTFSKGVLEMPPLQLWDESEAYFRSIILFEQTHLPLLENSYFVDYMGFLENLIKAPEDVQILVQSGIICNCIGSEETAARIFYGISKHLVLPTNFYYLGVCRDLNAYANTRWNHWKAILKRDYFRHPWAIISVIFGLLLFLLTLLQTVATFTQ